MASSPPSAALSGAVKGYCGYVEHTNAPLRRREAATGTITVIFSFGPRMRVDGVLHDSFVAGLSDVPVTTEHGGVQNGLELKLTPLGARRLFGVPMRELVNRVVALDDLLGTGTLVEELAEARGWEARFARVQDELSAAA